MSTPDYAAQAQALLANAPVHGPRGGWDKPAWTVDLIEPLNMTVDVGVASESEARADAGVVACVARAIRARDENG